jgi:hypothetical protein
LRLFRPTPLLDAYAPSQKVESDQAGLDRFIKLAFRRAVEKTGRVVTVVMGERR